MWLNLRLFRRKDAYSRVLTCILLCIDILSFGSAIQLIRHQDNYFMEPVFVARAFCSLLIWVIVASIHQLFTHSKLGSLKTILQSHLEVLPMMLLLQSVFFFFLLDIRPADLAPLLAFDAYALTLLISVKFTLILAYKCVRQQHRNRYIIVGYSAAGKRLHQYFEKAKPFSYHFLGYFDDTLENGLPIQGPIKALHQYCLQQQVDHIYLAIHDKPALLKELSDFADNHFIHFGYIIDQHPLQHQTLLRHKMHLVPLPGVNTNLQSTYL